MRENLPSRSSCTEVRHKNKILTIKSQYDYTNCMWTARCIIGTAPKAVMDIFEQFKNIERNAQLVIDNISNERVHHLAIKNIIAKAWNDLDLEMRRDLDKVLKKEVSGDNLETNADRIRPPSRESSWKNIWRQRNRGNRKTGNNTPVQKHPQRTKAAGAAHGTGPMAQ